MNNSRTASLDSTGTGNERKRVCKACDRCRLKKSKCDGLSPCARCTSDNTPCLFGERKRAQDKVYPKGYVEMLEHQQAMLTTGLRAMYKRLINGEGWEGEPLKLEESGHPLTHDMLLRLNSLYQVPTTEFEPIGPFEENFGRMQTRLIQSGAPMRTRRGSAASESDDHGSSNHDSPSSATGFPLEYSAITPVTPPTQEPFSNMARGASIKQEPMSYTSPTFENASWQVAARGPMPGPMQEPMLVPGTWNDDIFFNGNSIGPDNMLAYDPNSSQSFNNGADPSTWSSWQFEDPRMNPFGYSS